MTSLMEHVQCGVCREILVEPSTLPCGHSFCRTRCLIPWLHRTSSCPMCRVPFQPTSSVSVDVSVEQMCCLFRGTLCKVCDGIAVSKCSSCSRTLCRSCMNVPEPSDTLTEEGQFVIDSICNQCASWHPLVILDHINDLSISSTSTIASKDLMNSNAFTTLMSVETLNHLHCLSVDIANLLNTTSSQLISAAQKSTLRSLVPQIADSHTDPRSAFLSSLQSGLTQLISSITSYTTKTQLDLSEALTNISFDQYHTPCLLRKQLHKALISMYGKHVFFITPNGELYGLFDPISRYVPNRVSSPIKFLDNAKLVSSCCYYALVIDKSCVLWLLKNNTRTQLLDDVYYCVTGDHYSFVIFVISNAKILYCMASKSDKLEKVLDGVVDVEAFQFGCLLIPPDSKNLSLILSDVVSFFVGEDHCAAITEDSSLYCWGSNTFGQLGTEEFSPRDEVTKVLDNVAYVSLGLGHSMAITTSNELYCWGWNQGGQVGNGSTINQSTPIKIMDDVSFCDAGAGHSMAITLEGKLFCWGYNDYGEIGCKRWINHYSELNQLEPLFVMDNVDCCYAGDCVSLAESANGDVYKFGLEMMGIDLFSCSTPYKWYFAGIDRFKDSASVILS
ncbi:hypothetical protein GEMRC1_007210 [Eukaryota sp. GEM-RC1]